MCVILLYVVFDSLIHVGINMWFLTLSYMLESLILVSFLLYVVFHSLKYVRIPYINENTLICGI